MKHYFTMALGMVAMMMATTSCLKNEEGDNVTSQIYSANFTRVVDVATGSEYINNGTVYKLSYDYATGKYTLQIGNFKPNATTTPFNMEVKDLNFDRPQVGSLVISAAEVTATTRQGDMTVPHQLTNFVVKLNEYGLPGYRNGAVNYNFQFTYEGAYRASSVQTEAVYGGTTLIRDVNTGNTNNYIEPIYSFAIDNASGRAQIYINNLKLRDRLYPTVVIREVPYTLDDNGVKMELAGPVDVLVPNGGSSLPGFKVSHVNATMTNADLRASVAFTIDNDFSLSASLGK